MGGTIRTFARWLATFAGVAPIAAPAFASAWTQAPGTAQGITSIAVERSDFGETFRTDVFTEAGLEDGWGLSFKVEHEQRSGQEGLVNIRAGAHKSFAIGESASASIAAFYVGGDSLDGPDCTGEAYEVRGAVGTSFTFLGMNGFANAEVGYRDRDRAECDRPVGEIAVGLEFAPSWTAVVKSYADADEFSRSTKIEAMLLHDFGPVSVGLGWREEISGRFEERGFLVSMWQNF